MMCINWCAAFANARAAASRGGDYGGTMQSDLLEELRARKPEIQAHWAELLRVEPVTTPLAYPEALAHLISWTLDEIFHALAGAARHRTAHSRHLADKPNCPCGRNPLLAYFSSAEKVMQEALILAQSQQPHLEPAARDAALLELNLVLRTVARREIEAFCGVCQHRFEKQPAPCPLPHHAHA
jgi:hypothetical protein